MIICLQPVVSSKQLMIPAPAKIISARSLLRPAILRRCSKVVLRSWLKISWKACAENL